MPTWFSPAGEPHCISLSLVSCCVLIITVQKYPYKDTASRPIMQYHIFLRSFLRGKHKDLLNFTPTFSITGLLLWRLPPSPSWNHPCDIITGYFLRLRPLEPQRTVVHTCFHRLSSIPHNQLTDILCEVLNSPCKQWYPRCSINYTVRY